MKGRTPNYKGKVIDSFLKTWEALSKKEKEKTALALQEELIAVHKNVRQSQLKRGEIGAKLAATGAYKLLMGDDSATLSSYLAQPEFKVNIRQLYRVMSAWQVWINKFGYTVDKVYEIPIELLEQVGQIATEETEEDWFHALKTLSAEDIRIYINEQKGITQEDCDHDYKTVKKCVKCREIAAGAKER